MDNMKGKSVVNGRIEWRKYRQLRRAEVLVENGNKLATPAGLKALFPGIKPATPKGK